MLRRHGKYNKGELFSAIYLFYSFRSNTNDDAHSLTQGKRRTKKELRKNDGMEKEKNK